MTRKEHLEWCKARAREYLDRGDGKNAVASFQSDMMKHDETAEMMRQPFVQMIAVPTMMAVIRGDVREVRSYIEGFN